MPDIPKTDPPVIVGEPSEPAKVVPADPEPVKNTCEPRKPSVAIDPTTGVARITLPGGKEDDGIPA